jgi:hypothetical protein
MRILALRMPGGRLLSSLPKAFWGLQSTSLILIWTILALAAGTLSAQNPGDPLYCQPQEGTTYLIVNGGTGIFTVNADCYNNNISNDVTTSITTGMGGTLTLTRVGGDGNYAYAPPNPSFTGLDTFSIPVTTVYNSAGGTGSAGGTVRPGGPATLNITLNVLPAITALTVAGAATTVPVPLGSVSSCSSGGAAGNPGQGPPAGAVLGCVTGIIQGFVHPAHGTLTAPTSSTLLYTPTGGYTGPDTFTYEAVGVNTDGSSALESGEITVQVTVTQAAPSTPAPSTLVLMFLGIASLVAFYTLRRRANPSAV